MLPQHKISGRCLLGIIVVVALAPGVSWGGPTAVDPANGAGQGEYRAQDAPRQHSRVAARPMAHGSVRASPRRTVYRPGSVVTMAPVVSTAALPSGGLPKQPQRAMTVPHFTPNASSPNAVSGVSGNAVGRHTTGSAAIGGPATYDARKGALINGTTVRRRF